MSSTDSTIPDTRMGDSVGGQGGQSFTEKAKTAIKGNIPTTDDKPQDTATSGGGSLGGAKNTTTSSTEQNTLL